MLTEAQLGLLKEAVNLAKDRQIRSVAILRRDMHLLHPGKEKDVDAAITAWSVYSKRSVQYPT